MKDLFKPKQQSGEIRKKSSEPAVANKKDVRAFLDKVAKMPKTSGDARMLFALDATASRQPTWDVAMQLQTEMFVATQSLGGLHLQLCYFRGFGEFFTSDWQNNGDELVRIMSRMHCEAGATQIEKLLQHAISENERARIKCLVYIGDAMEENIDRLAHLAGKLGILNVPVFVFQEGSDSIARQAFLEISRLSGGAYSQFDQASAAQLKELLQAVAIYTAGGLKALQDFSKQSGKAVKLLEQQLKS